MSTVVTLPQLQAHCQHLSRALVAHLTEHSRCKKTALHIDKEIEQLYIWIDKKRVAEKTKLACEHYIGLIEAKNDLLRIHSIHHMLDKGSTFQEVSENFPDWEQGMIDDWNDCERALKEVAGLLPLHAFERDRQDWIDHWRYLYPRAGEQDRKAIITLAKKQYPDIDLTLITAETLT